MKNNDIADKQLEKLISISINEKIKDIEKTVDVDGSWERFQKKAKEIGSTNISKKRNKGLLRLLVVACSIVLLVVLYKIDNVTAHKSLINQLHFITEGGDRIISEGQSIKIENGYYYNLSFQQAQELTVFHLKAPTYLYNDIDTMPSEINVNVIAYPIAQATIKYQTELLNGKSIILEQENMDINFSRNTYIPDNIVVEKENINGREITIIFSDNSNNATWVENAIRYTLITHGIDKSELIRIINSIK